MVLILHITPRRDWEQALQAGQYEALSLHTQGFIHCSTPAQVVAVANALFRGRRDLVLLCIDRDAVAAPIRDENCEGGDKLFPHIYGPLNLQAVMDVVEFPPRPDGTFELPPSLR